MDKKLLVGVSAIAVVILVLASLSPVVGYHSVKSTSVRDSPLFAVRTKRAINEESKTLTSDYVGKGEEINILIPMRDSKVILVQKIISRINTVSEEEFNKLISLVIHHIDKSQKVDTQAIIKALHQLRDNPDEIKRYITQEKEHKLYTAEGCETVGFIWIPECWLDLIWLMIISPFIWLVLSLATMILDCF